MKFLMPTLIIGAAGGITGVGYGLKTFLLSEGNIQKSDNNDREEGLISKYMLQNLETNSSRICYMQIQKSQDNPPEDIQINCDESYWNISDSDKNQVGIWIRTSLDKVETVLGNWELSKGDFSTEQKQNWKVQSFSQKLKNLNFDCEKKILESKVEVKCIKSQES